MGYAVQSGASAYPQRSFILQGQSFAVHDDVPTEDVLIIKAVEVA